MPNVFSIFIIALTLPARRQTISVTELHVILLRGDIMITKRLLIMTAALVLAHLTVASTSLAQARLNELSSRLMTEANQFADASYRPLAGAFRESRNAQAAMLAHHFSGGARLFNRMVTDRVRRNDLRDAFNVLQSLATPIDSNNVDGNRWSNIQRLMADISSALNNPRDDPRDDDNFPGRSGRMTWRGRVDETSGSLFAVAGRKWKRLAARLITMPLLTSTLRCHDVE